MLGAEAILSMETLVPRMWLAWGVTRDLVKKIRDTKGRFHAKMGSIKDRNGVDLTEATGKPGVLQSMRLQSRTRLSN